jgi:hypothetical protein
MRTYFSKLFTKLFDYKKEKLLDVKSINDAQPRFTITINGIRRKVFTYFQASTDGSIAFHTYLPGKYSGQLRLGADFSNATMNLNEMERRDDFIIQKINFHKSGEVTTKSSTGERFDHDKSYSVALERFKDGKNDLCFLQPVAWEVYPVVTDQKNYVELTRGDLNVLPPIIQFYVCVDDSRILAAHAKVRKTVNWFVDENILKQFGLKLFISVRSHKDGRYPPQQVFAVYQYDQESS